jgi:hypothetical protein
VGVFNAISMAYLSKKRMKEAKIDAEVFCSVIAKASESDISTCPYGLLYMMKVIQTE